MIKGVDHIGIMVRDIEKSLQKLSEIVHSPEPVVKTSAEMQMTAAVVDLGNVNLEFLQSNSDDSVFAAVVRDKGDSIHHFCLLSDNIDEDVAAIQDRGVEMMDEEPTVGIRGKRRAMSKPSALNGISIEVSEA